MAQVVCFVTGREGSRSPVWVFGISGEVRFHGDPDACSSLSVMVLWLWETRETRWTIRSRDEGDEVGDEGDEVDDPIPTPALRRA